MKKRSLLSFHAAGHGWTCEAIGLPSIGWVPEKAEPSPKVQRLLALVNGKREYIDRIPMNTNLCYSDPEAIDRFCNTVVDYVKEHPETDYLHIWLADEYNHICECESCRKTTLSDQYVHLLNLIDQRLTQEHLDCKLVFLLYQELLYPPVKERFQNPDRFRPHVCSHQPQPSGNPIRTGSRRFPFRNTGATRWFFLSPLRKTLPFSQNGRKFLTGTAWFTTTLLAVPTMGISAMFPSAKYLQGTFIM